MYTERDHIFVICAYQESPFLEDCILSLKAQTKRADIAIATSTPNELIEKFSQKYEIPVWIRSGQSGIANDWNFALKIAEKKVATIAHQDDIYCENYLESLLECLNRSKQPLIFFSDYGELRNGQRITDTKLLKIKRVMLFPLRILKFQRSRWIRRRILSLGSPISCPTVSYVLENLEQPVFQQQYRGSVDWQAWEKISRKRGSFVYCTKVLMYHRIHEESETSAIIKESIRTQEDYEMYCKFWPEWVARVLIRFYSKGQESNQL